MKKTYIVLLVSSMLAFISCNQTHERNDQNSIDKEIETDVVFKDFGPEPFVFNIEEYTTQNDTYRTSVWTGEYMQMTVMSIPAGGDIGEEMHSDIDQFLRIEAGTGVILMGDEEGVFNFEARVEHDFAR